jgi:hypothetical protein
MQNAPVKLLSLATCTALSLCIPSFCCAQIEVPEGTKVRVRLDQQLSSETAKVGDVVRLSVANDVKMSSVFVIKRGTVVAGKVLSAVPRRSLGRPGKLDFSIDAILLYDGGRIPLRYSLEKNQGRPSADEQVGVLTLNGHDTELYEGATYDVFTDATYLAVVPAAQAPGGSLPLDAPSIGVVYFLDSSSHTLESLPDEPWRVHRRQDAEIIEVAGERSYVRITSNKPEFVFKIGNPENAYLYAFNIDDKFSVDENPTNRRWFSLIHKIGQTKEVSSGIPVEITKFGESSYRIVPTLSLRPGEYAIVLSTKLFSFGIDQ